MRLLLALLAVTGLTAAAVAAAGNGPLYAGRVSSPPHTSIVADITLTNATIPAGESINCHVGEDNGGQSVNGLQWAQVGIIRDGGGLRSYAEWLGQGDTIPHFLPLPLGTHYSVDSASVSKWTMSIDGTVVATVKVDPAVGMTEADAVLEASDSHTTGHCVIAHTDQRARYYIANPPLTLSRSDGDTTLTLDAPGNP